MLQGDLVRSYYPFLLSLISVVCDVIGSVELALNVPLYILTLQLALNCVPAAPERTLAIAFSRLLCITALLPESILLGYDGIDTKDFGVEVD